MKRRTLVLIAGLTLGGSATLLGACANDGAATTTEPSRGQPVPEPSDGVVDSGAEAADDGAAICSDCEHYPATCRADVLCPGGPFDPKTAGGAFDPRTRVHVIRGRAANDVWAAGALGTLAHFDGASWTRSESGTQEVMKALWLRDAEEVALGRLERVYSRGVGIPDAGISPGGWSWQTSALPPSYVRPTLESAWAPAEAEWLWTATATEASTLHKSDLFRLRRTPSGQIEVAYGLDNTACADIMCRRLTSIHGTSPNRLWVVGHEGKTLRVSGAQGDAPTVEVFNSQTWEALHGVWAASETEAWSVGAGGTIRHYTGDPLMWEVVSNVPTTTALNAVWGSSPTDVWAVGDAAIVLHYDGKAWSRVKIAGLGTRRPALFTVWAPAPGHVWIGGEGVVLSLGGMP